MGIYSIEGCSINSGCYFNNGHYFNSGALYGPGLMQGNWPLEGPKNERAHRVAVMVETVSVWKTRGQPSLP